nr:hypothetical protein [Candidatus Dadabacteria bacterium]
STGRNFAAGMSGGIAYIFDKEQDFETKLNTEMVSLNNISDEDQNILKKKIEKHLEYTASAVARNILNTWSESIKRFKKVVPNDYKRMLAHIKAAEDKGLGGDDALMAAFEENKRDLARVSGN